MAEFTGPRPTLVDLAELHGIKIVTAKPKERPVCAARELAPCTDPHCPHCWQRRHG
jgi:hypothetical protein